MVRKEEGYRLAPGFGVRGLEVMLGAGHVGPKSGQALWEY